VREERGINHYVTNQLSNTSVLSFFLSATLISCCSLSNLSALL
jgi:hypothetical protein